MRAAMFFALAACASSDTDVSTATQFLDKISHKFCDQSFACKSTFPTDWGVTFEEEYGASANQCYSASMEDAPVIEERITAGTIKFTAADASDCLAGITFPACQQYWQDGPTMPDSCFTALVGTVADGGACMIDYECASETSICDASTCKPDTGMRTKGAQRWSSAAFRSL